ncbi:MAG: thiamine pyrophosphate-dependent enzyme, partial [Dehalococcoidia bacterium]
GVPVVPISIAAMREGIKFVGVRHEQAAGYAAQAASYMNGRISAALVVSGPGMTNAITALGNAQANCWPMLLIGGAANISQSQRGDFQDAPQVAAARPFVKWADSVTDARRIPRAIASAVRSSISGRPGPVYLDLPGDVIDASVDESEIQWEARVPDPPRTRVDDDSVRSAIEALKSASNPLVIVGKGAAWSRAENEVREFIDKTHLPFLPTPMGKGVIPDDHPLNVSAARTSALKGVDVVFTIGARFNWILHFGLPPRFREDLRVIQLDIEPEEIGRNVPTEVPLVGDAQAVMGQLNASLDESPWEYEDTSEWKASLSAEVERKRKENEEFYNSDEVPMGYYRPLKEIEDVLPRDAIFVTEGENTMGIARTVINSYEPRARLDAGTWGTMGVGPGFALAAQTLNPGKRVVALEGDAAFGFGPMEVETAVRHKLPITWIIFNNNGIGSGVAKIDESKPLPPNVLLPGSHYERIIEAFGGKGYYCTTPDQVKAALQDSFNQEGSTLIHVELAPRAMRRKQQFGWLTR